MTAFGNGGNTHWSCGREFAFYLTDDGRLVPFAGGGAKDELPGLTLREFLRLLAGTE